MVRGTLVPVLRSVRIAKRAIDFLGAAAGMALTAPLMPVIAAAIYLDSPGPIFYSQRRAGSLRATTVENGVRRLHFAEFTMHKFRTMSVNAEANTGVVIASANDSRVTRVGTFLRKSRPADLPQFSAVLRGQMSIVRARP